MQLDIKKLPDGDVRLTVRTSPSAAPASFDLPPAQVDMLIGLLATARRAAVFSFTWSSEES